MAHSFNPSTQRPRQANLWFWDQPNLYSEFPVSQGPHSTTLINNQVHIKKRGLTNYRLLPVTLTHWYTLCMPSVYTWLMSSICLCNVLAFVGHHLETCLGLLFPVSTCFQSPVPLSLMVQLDSFPAIGAWSSWFWEALGIEVTASRIIPRWKWWAASYNKSRPQPSWHPRFSPGSASHLLCAAVANHINTLSLRVCKMAGGALPWGLKSSTLRSADKKHLLRDLGWGSTFT